MDEIMKDIKKFLTAQKKAEKAGKYEFDCPLCGGKAVWARSDWNNHLHCGCKSCGFQVME